LISRIRGGYEAPQVVMEGPAEEPEVMVQKADVASDEMAGQDAGEQQVENAEVEADEVEEDEQLELLPQNIHTLPTVEPVKISTVPMTAEQKIKEAQRLMREARMELTPYDIQPLSNSLLSTGERTWQKKHLIVKKTYVPVGRGGDRIYSIPFKFGPSNRIN